MILGRIFERDPRKRIGLPELQQMILACPSFTTSSHNTGLLTPPPDSAAYVDHNSNIAVSPAATPLSPGSSLSSISSSALSVSKQSSHSSWSSVASQGSYQASVKTIINPRPPQVLAQSTMEIPQSYAFFPGSFLNSCCAYLCGPWIPQQQSFASPFPMVC